MHDEACAGHSGLKATYKRVVLYFYWPKSKELIKKWIQDVFQRKKIEYVRYTGLLQPLLIPEHAWQDISMDFIEGLPKSEGKDTILVVVDRSTKYSNFHPPFTASSIADIFSITLVKYNGLPNSVVSD